MDTKRNTMGDKLFTYLSAELYRDNERYYERAKKKLQRTKGGNPDKTVNEYNQNLSKEFTRLREVAFSEDVDEVSTNKSDRIKLLRSVSGYTDIMFKETTLREITKLTNDMSYRLLQGTLTEDEIMSTVYPCDARFIYRDKLLTYISLDDDALLALEMEALTVTENKEDVKEAKKLGVSLEVYIQYAVLMDRLCNATLDNTEDVDAIDVELDEFMVIHNIV